MKYKKRAFRELLINGSLIIIGTIVGLLIMEAGVRIRQYVKYGTVAGYVGANMIKDRGLDLRVLDPGTRTRSSAINSQGFRGPELKSPKPPNTLRLAFLGSSTTFCAEVSSNDNTWPNLVWRMLQNKYPNVRFDYLNAAAPGYTVLSDVITLEKRVRSFQPDVIIIYEGFNDISWNASILSGRREKEGVYREGWLEKRSLTYDIIKKNILIAFSSSKARSMKPGMRFEGGKLSADYRKKLIKLIMVSKRTAPVVAIATLSYKFRHEQTDEMKLRNANTALLYAPSLDVNGLFQAFEEYNRVIREAAKDNGIILIGDELSIPGNDVNFRDSTHMTDQGCELMAKRVAYSLINAPEFTGLLRSKTVENPISEKR